MSERIKEIREWGNFVLTAVVAVGFPICILVLHNQRLEIEKAADQKYVDVDRFSRFETATNNKLDRIADSMEGVQRDVAAIQGRLAINNLKNSRP